MKLVRTLAESQSNAIKCESIYNRQINRENSNEITQLQQNNSNKKENITKKKKKSKRTKSMTFVIRTPTNHKEKLKKYKRNDDISNKRLLKYRNQFIIAIGP